MRTSFRFASCWKSRSSALRVTVPRYHRVCASKLHVFNVYYTLLLTVSSVMIDGPVDHLSPPERTLWAHPSPITETRGAEMPSGFSNSVVHLSIILHACGCWRRRRGRVWFIDACDRGSGCFRRVISVKMWRELHDVQLATPLTFVASAFHGGERKEWDNSLFYM